MTRFNVPSISLKALPLLALMGAGSPAMAGEIPQYRATKLDFMNLQDPGAVMNDRGDVAFPSPTGYRILKADGTRVNIPYPPGSTGLLIRGISNLGQVLFVDRREQGRTQERTFVWDRVLGHRFFSWDTSGNAINDEGWVAGGGGAVDETPFLWNFLTGEWRVLPTPPEAPYATVYHLENSGRAAGGGFGRGVVWNGDQAMAVEGDQGWVSSLNESGLAVGSQFVLPQRYGRIWDSQGRLIHQMSTPSSLHSVNEAGRIVGGSATLGAIILDDQYQPISLQSRVISGVDLPLLGATKISDSGQILALGGQGETSAWYRLDPVPEPTSLAALGVGLAAFVRRRRARA